MLERAITENFAAILLGNQKASEADFELSRVKHSLHCFILHVSFRTLNSIWSALHLVHDSKWQLE